MTTPFQNDDGSPLDIRVIIVGIEGQLVNTEQLHYEKWERIALRAGYTEEGFRKLWKSQLIGIGDEAVYKKLQANAPTSKKLPKWEVVREQINKYYLKHFYAAQFLEGEADAIDMLTRFGVRFIVVTHATGELADMQLDRIKSEIGTALWNKDPVSGKRKDVVLGKRKDGNAYDDIFNEINKERLANNLPPLKRENFLVLENKKEYRDKARSFGMHALGLRLDLADHLKPETPDDEDLSIKWEDITAFIVRGPVPQSGISPATAPR